MICWISSRLARLAEAEQLDSASAYLPVEYLADVQAGLFAELQQDAARSTRCAAICSVFCGYSAEHTADDYAGDLRGAARWALEQLLPELQDAEARSGNATTAAHLADPSHRIVSFMKPRRHLPEPGNSFDISLSGV